VKTSIRWDFHRHRLRCFPQSLHAAPCGSCLIPTRYWLNGCLTVNSCDSAASSRRVLDDAWPRARMVRREPGRVVHRPVGPDASAKMVRFFSYRPTRLERPVGAFRPAWSRELFGRQWAPLPILVSRPCDCAPAVPGEHWPPGCRYNLSSFARQLR